MMKRIRIISAGLILAIVCVVIATRPERPPIAAVAYNPDNPLQATRAKRYLAELDRLGRQRDKAQYVLEVFVRDVVTLKTSKGEVPLDEGGAKLLSRVDVLYPTAPSIAARLVVLDILMNAQWVVSTDEEEKFAWAEVFQNSSISNRLDGTVLCWELVESEVRKARPKVTSFVLMQPGDPLVLPASWRQTCEPTIPLSAGMALVYLSPLVPGFEPDAEVVFVRVGEYDATGFDIVIYKDVATIAARMSLEGLDRKKLIMLPKPPMLVKVEQPKSSPHDGYEPKLQ